LGILGSWCLSVRPDHSVIISCGTAVLYVEEQSHAHHENRSLFPAL